MSGSSSDPESGAKKPGKCMYYARNIATFLVSHIGLVSLVVGYCIMGAFAFEALEADNERQVKRKMSQVREAVTNDLWKITEEMPVLDPENWTTTVTNRMKSFEMDLIESMKKKGWDGSEDVEKIQWTYAGALFYSIILITTIGYGHIAPKTQWGKVVTIFYAVLGIPLMLLCLANIGDAMAHSFRFLYWKVCCYVCTRKPKKSRLRRTRTLRSTAGKHSRTASRPTSLRRSQRASQRSADSAMSDSAMSRSSHSSDIIDTKNSRYYDETEHDLEMMPVNGPQRGRRSQHSRRAGRPGASGGVRHPAAGIDNVELDYPASPGGKNASDHMESGFFNKYAMDEAEGRKGVADPPDVKSGVSSGGSVKSRDRVDAAQDPENSEMTDGVTRGSHRYSNKSGGSRDGRLSRLAEQDEMDYVDDEDYGYEYEYTDYSEDEEEETHHNKPVPIWLSIFLVVGYIFGGAWMFSGWEQWSFLDSAYFCFITLTTIGFGDFVPAQNVKENVEVSIALCSLYLLFGIALLAMSFNLVQEEVINSVKSVAKRLGIIKDEDEEDN